MKVYAAWLLLVLVVADEANPLEKVLEMISGMQAEIIGEAENAQKMYTEFSNWCEDRSQELHFEIKTGKAQVSSLKAAIDKGTADSQVLESKIGDNAADISEDESELKKATAIREGDNKAFVDLEKELMATVDMIERALSIVQKEMQGGAFLQMDSQRSAQSVVQALRSMVEASSISSSDAARLTALIQSSSANEDEDSEDEDQLGAPAASATENQSGGVVETLQGLLEKAESQLQKARNEEQSAAQEYAMKKQSLEDSRSLASKELTEAKSELAATKEKKAVNGGDLESTAKDLREDIKELEDLHHTCLGKATDFEEETKARGEELKTLATAKKILSETTGAASSQTYGLVDTSFVQVASKQHLSSGAGALRIIRHLAYSKKSPVLTQLASRIQSTLRFGSADGANPFKKVQGMIMDMLTNLEKEAEAEATEKEYCDKEMAESEGKLDDKKDEASALSTKIEQMTSASDKLKSEVSVLQKELAALTKTQAEMDQLRQKENAAYSKSRPELEQGLNGVKKALKVLKNYYAKSSFIQAEAGSKDATAIIGLLEVAESDFSKLLAEMIADEEQSQAAYTETTNENNVAKKVKEQDVKFKTKEAAGLDKSSTELKSDLGGVSDELGAINEYHKELKGRCVKKAPSYEEVKKAREEEIAGLKEALMNLEGSAMFFQLGSRTLRGIRRA